MATCQAPGSGVVLTAAKGTAFLAVSSTVATVSDRPCYPWCRRGGEAAGHGSMVTSIAWPLRLVVSALAN
jgi:hypothetical protein